jgi:hypothetical protein
MLSLFPFGASMQILKVQDPRNTLDRARRSELAAFAKANGVKEIVPTMPATLMRKILRSKGLTNIVIPNRQLGQVSPTKIDLKGAQRKSDNGHSRRQQSEENVVEVDAEEDLMRQWLAQQNSHDLADEFPTEAYRERQEVRPVAMPAPRNQPQAQIENYSAPTGKKRAGAQKITEPIVAPYERFPVHAIRKELKRRGVKTLRTDRMPALIQRLYDNDKDAA